MSGKSNQKMEASNKFFTPVEKNGEIYETDDRRI